MYNAPRTHLNTKAAMNSARFRFIWSAATEEDAGNCNESLRHVFTFSFISHLTKKQHWTQDSPIQFARHAIFLKLSTWKGAHSGRDILSHLVDCTSTRSNVLAPSASNDRCLRRISPTTADPSLTRLRPPCSFVEFQGILWTEVCDSFRDRRPSLPGIPSLRHRVTWIG